MEAYSNKPFFVVEGNIGSGKSTFLKILNQYLNMQVIYEPHQRWQNVDGENILDYFYKDPSRWAYTFQTYAFITRLQELENKNSNFPCAIMERSIFSDRYCFSKNCYEMGMMNTLEWKLYKDLFNSIVSENVNLRPSGFIYLQTDPEICYQRLIKRNRTEENNVSLDYLKLLHEKHEAWLVEKKVDVWLKDIPILIIKSNEDFEDNISINKKHVTQIADFLLNECSLPKSLTLQHGVLANL